MSAHTPGRLTLELVESDTGTIKHLCPVDAEGMSLLTVVDHDEKKFAAVYNDHDARRLVAAWNACEGIPIEALEAYPAIAPNGMKAIRHVEAQRDELLAAMKELEALDFGANVTTDDDERRIDRVAQRARAAIQKVEGK